MVSPPKEQPSASAEADAAGGSTLEAGASAEPVAGERARAADVAEPNDPASSTPPSTRSTTAFYDDSPRQGTSTRAVDARASTSEVWGTEPDAGGCAEQAGDVAEPNDALQDSSVRGAMLNDSDDDLPPGSRNDEDVRGLEEERPRGPSGLRLPPDEEHHQNTGQLCCVVSCNHSERTQSPTSVGRTEADQADLQDDDTLKAASRQIFAARGSVGDNDDDEHLYTLNYPGVRGHEENTDKDVEPEEEDSSVDGSEAEIDEEEDQVDEEEGQVDEEEGQGKVVILDKSMRGWRPKTSKTGGLPNIFCEPRKPVGFGTMFISNFSSDNSFDTIQRRRRRDRRRVRLSHGGLE